MKFNSFEEILSWQKAKELTLSINDTFRFTSDFAYKTQIENASVAIMNNIAQGFERQVNREFIKFLYEAKGTSGEVRSMLIVAKEMDIIEEEKFQELHDITIEISKILAGLIKALKGGNRNSNRRYSQNNTEPVAATNEDDPNTFIP